MLDAESHNKYVTKTREKVGGQLLVTKWVDILSIGLMAPNQLFIYLHNFLKYIKV